MRTTIISIGQENLTLRQTDLAWRKHREIPGCRCSDRHPKTDKQLSRDEIPMSIPTSVGRVQAGTGGIGG
jgi:hypothetical protein